MNQLPVYILAGGRSSRFGSDKARAIVHNKPLLAHVAAMLEPVTSSLTVIADRADKYHDLGFRTIADCMPDLGPLGGLDTAISDLPAAQNWLLLCSCDALVIHRTWLNCLSEGIADGHDAVAFQGDRWQPMPAMYARSAAPVIAEQLHNNQRSMQALLRRLHTMALPLPNDWPQHWQANTPEELSHFQVG